MYNFWTKAYGECRQFMMMEDGVLLLIIRTLQARLESNEKRWDIKVEDQELGLPVCLMILILLRIFGMFIRLD